MKKILILLCVPVQMYAQVSLMVEPFNIVSPADNQTFLTLEFTSQDPVRIEECTIEFDDDYIFDFVDRLALHQDSSVLPVLSHELEFLYNPWTHYPSVYVGIGNDTAVNLAYHIDTYRYYPYALGSSISCRVNYYTQIGSSNTVLGPVQVSSGVVLSIDEKSQEDVISVHNIDGGLSIKITSRFCESFVLMDAEGKLVVQIYESQDVYVRPGMYTLMSSDCMYAKKYIVQ